MFRYRVAEPGSADLDTWYALRQRVFLETGLITPDDIDPGPGVYTDEYDGHSIHLLAAEDSGADVGCCRMVVHGGDDRPLPVADLFDVDVLPDSYEASGLAVLPEYRKTYLTLGIYRAMFAVAEEHGLDHAYAIVERPYLASLEAHGFPYEILGEPRFVFNETNVAILRRKQDMFPALSAAEGPLPAMVLRYYRKPFDWTLTEHDITQPVS